MKITFDISEPLLDLSLLDSPDPVNSHGSIIIPMIIDERRQFLQRGLNMEDAAKSLLKFMKEEITKLHGEKASTSSLTDVELELADMTKPISQVDALDAIKTGSFNINGVNFQVNTATDSLQNIIDNINNSEAGVKISYSYSDEQITITSKREKPLFLQNGSSDFFEGVALKEGYLVGENGVEIKELFEREIWQQKFSRFASRFNKLMETDFDKAKLSGFNNKVINLFQGAIQSHIDNNFLWGSSRLNSNLEVLVHTTGIKFTKFKIGFNNLDNPSNLYNFLSSSNGILNSLAAISGSQTKMLQENLQPFLAGGLIVNKKI